MRAAAARPCNLLSPPGGARSICQPHQQPAAPSLLRGFDAAAASSTMATAVYRIGCARTQLLGGGLAASGKKRAALRRPVKAAGVKASALYEKRSFTKSLINDCTERA